MTDCIFCKIVKGEAPCHKIYEDDTVFAILDIFPSIKGQAVVISKEHKDPYVFNSDDEFLKKYFISVKKVAEKVRKALDAPKISVVFEGTGVDHLHAKIYPMMGKLGSETGVEIKGKFFDEYPGYITTLIGPRMPDEKLKEIADKIRSAT